MKNKHEWFQLSPCCQLKQSHSLSNSISKWHPNYQNTSTIVCFGVSVVVAVKYRVHNEDAKHRGKQSSRVKTAEIVWNRETEQQTDTQQWWRWEPLGSIRSIQTTQTVNRLATDFVLTLLRLKKKSMIQNKGLLLLESVHLYQTGLLYRNSNSASKLSLLCMYLLYSTFNIQRKTFLPSTTL